MSIKIISSVDHIFQGRIVLQFPVDLKCTVYSYRTMFRDPWMRESSAWTEARKHESPDTRGTTNGCDPANVVTTACAEYVVPGR